MNDKRDNKRRKRNVLSLNYQNINLLSKLKFRYIIVYWQRKEINLHLKFIRKLT